MVSLHPNIMFNLMNNNISHHYIFQQKLSEFSQLTRMPGVIFFQNWSSTNQHTANLYRNVKNCVLAMQYQYALAA